MTWPQHEGEASWRQTSVTDKMVLQSRIWIRMLPIHRLPFLNSRESKSEERLVFQQFPVDKYNRLLTLAPLTSFLFASEIDTLREGIKSWHPKKTRELRKKVAPLGRCSTMSDVGMRRVTPSFFEGSESSLWVVILYIFLWFTSGSTTILKGEHTGGGLTSQ